MNKIVNHIIIALSLLLVSCNGWLDLEPANSITLGDFWQDEKDIQAVITSCYGTLEGTLEREMYWSELRGGLVSPGQKSTSSKNIMEFFDYNITQENSYVKWDTYYKVINYCNAILAYADGVMDTDPDLSEMQTNYYKSEALALRALCYLHIVKTYRDAPLQLKPFDTDDNDLEVAKAPEEKIIAQVIEDLKQAIPWSKLKYSDLETTKGRIGTYSVYAILAEAYLWDNQYSKCDAICDSVINSFQFGLVHSSEYFDLYLEGNTPEGIFELQFDRNKGETNNLYSLTVNGERNYMKLSDYMSTLYSTSDSRGELISVNSDISSIWKFCGASTEDEDKKRGGSGESDANWIYYRLADIYLMKAEALAEQGLLDMALVPLNQVRLRAGLNPILSGVTTIDQFINILLIERAREFIGEGKRWYDLVRIARRDPANRQTIILENVLRNVSSQYISATEDKVSDINSWYLPIYYKELEANKALQQNPFYEVD